MRGASTRVAIRQHRSVAKLATNLTACVKLVGRTARHVAPHRRIARSLIRALIALTIRGGIVLMLGWRDRGIGGHRGRSRTRRSTATRLHCAAATATTTTRLSVTNAEASSTSQHGRETEQFESRKHGKALSEIGRTSPRTRQTGVITRQERLRDPWENAPNSPTPFITHTSSATHTRGTTDSQPTRAVEHTGRSNRSRFPRGGAKHAAHKSGLDHQMPKDNDSVDRWYLTTDTRPIILLSGQRNRRGLPIANDQPQPQRGNIELRHSDLFGQRRGIGVFQRTAASRLQIPELLARRTVGRRSCLSCCLGFLLRHQMRSAARLQ